MAINFGKDKETLFASTDLMSFGKAFSRMAAQPLDMYEVWYDYDALVAYAANTDSATATAYVGQKVAYIDSNNQVFHYSIEADGSLKELGVTPVGDEASIEVSEEGMISLKGVGTLTFTEATEDGETVDVQYQPLMTKNGLVWVRPSATTVEGLAALIEALDVRVTASETAIEETNKVVENLGKALESEIKRAIAEEDRLEKSIKDLADYVDTIDFVDNKELEDALQPYAKAEDVVSTEVYATDKRTIEASIAGAYEAAEAAQATIDDFLRGTGAEGVIDSLTEIKKALDDLTDASELAEAIAGKADKTELANYVEKTVYEGHLTTQSEKDAAQDQALVNYKAEVEGLLAGKQATGDYATKTEAQGYATTAKTEAIADADAKLANKADSSYVGIIPSNYTETNVIAYVNKKAEEVLSQATGGSSESAASVKAALDTYVAENEPKFAKLEGIAAGAQVNVIEGVQVDGTDLAITDKKVNIILTPYAKQADLDTVSAQANKGVSDAAAAQTKANSAYDLANENKGTITTLAGTVAEHKAAADLVTGRVSVLETAKADHEARVGALETTILEKANQSALTALESAHNTRITALESDNTTNKGAISALQGTVSAHSELLVGLDGTTTVKALIEDAKAAGTTAQGQITSLVEGTIAQHTTAIAKNAEDIAKNAQAIAANGELIAGNTAEIGKNAQAITALTTRVATNEGAISTLDGRVTAVESRTTALETRIEGLTGAMHFVGVKESIPTEFEGYAKGDVILVDKKEYVFDGTSFVELGDEGSYALKTEVYTTTQVDGMFSTVNGSIGTINGQISTINTGIETINGNIETINTSLTTLGGDIAAVDAKYEAALTWGDMQ